MSEQNLFFGVFDAGFKEKRDSFGFGFGLAPSLEDLVESFNQMNSDVASENADGDEGEATFESVAQLLFDQMIAYLDVFPLGVTGIPLMRRALLNSHVADVIDPIKLEKVVKGDLTCYRVPSHHILSINRKTNQAKRRIDSLDVIPNVLLLGLVSQFDGFMSQIIKVLASVKPHIIVESDRTFSAKDLFEMNNIQDALDQLLEKEIETVLRKSHREQFEWLEKKTKKTLLGDEVFPKFFEIFERRNLFAHANGVISKSYLKNCKEYGYNATGVIGEQLDITAEYLYNSTSILLEVGLKLSQVLSRSLMPKERLKETDAYLQDWSYELLTHEHYHAALAILDFAFTPSVKHHDKRGEYVLRVNRAIALKNVGRSEEMMQELSPMMAMPLSMDFQLCLAAIADDHETLLAKMSGLDPKVIQLEYFIEWPAFKSVRANPDFLEALQKIFGDHVVFFDSKSKHVSV